MASIEDLKSEISLKGGPALPTLYSVYLPSFNSANAESVNVLCSAVNLPGRQIMTQERRIGTIMEKVAYDQAYDDVNISFYLLNNYGMRRYFEEWQNLAINQKTYEVGYKTEYAKDVKISQLNRDGAVVYQLTLQDAFPTTLDQIELRNDLVDQLIQLNVQLSYKNWTSDTTLSEPISGASQRSGLGPTFSGLGNTITNTIAGGVNQAVADIAQDTTNRINSFINNIF